MLGKGFFITGTDTNVGKTVVSALFLSALKQKYSAKYFKPVQTGSDSDTETVRILSGGETYPPVYTFAAPMSPDRAAALENKTISSEKIYSVFSELKELLIVEGAGGLEVPLNGSEKMSSLMQKFKLPTVLVASTRLGTINHTLLSVERLKSLGIPFAGLVLCGDEDPGLRQVFEREGVQVLFEVPQTDLKKDWSLLVDKISPAIEALVDKCGANGDKQASDVIDVERLDQEIIWHPYTQHAVRKDFPEVSGARGVELFLKNGQTLIDAISSWWVTLHGHAEPQIAEAIAVQAKKLEHVIFAGYTHEPAVKLASLLLGEVQKSVPDIKKVFYSDNGSTAVEVALKMAYQAQKQKGQLQRNRFLALQGSYHGDTLAAMSASDRNGFHKIFTPLMAPVDFVEPGDFEALKKINWSDYAAVIVEPLVQGASGMRFYSEHYLQELFAQAQARGVYTIADEVFTGFYRTGKFLACEHAQVQPDFICLSKGITGGFLPLSVTLTTIKVFKNFESANMEQAFLHGHSYTANPVACAAAIASMEILQGSQARIENLTKWTREGLETLNDFKNVKNIRAIGTLGAFDVDGHAGYFNGQFSQRLALAAQTRGVLLRPLGGTVYTLLPYGASEDQVKKVYGVIRSALQELEIK